MEKKTRKPVKSKTDTTPKPSRYDRTTPRPQTITEAEWASFFVKSDPADDRVGQVGEDPAKLALRALSGGLTPSEVVRRTNASAMEVARLLGRADDPLFLAMLREIEHEKRYGRY